jgi:hypothetical protein
MLGILTGLTIIVLILILIGLCIPKWFPKSFGKIEAFSNPNDKFLNIPDSQLYQTMDPNIKPNSIKYQIPIAQNQLTDTQLQFLDTDILRNVRSQVRFSLTDEFTFHQMYNLLKRFQNSSYDFNFDPSRISKKSTVIESEKIIELNTGAINNVNLELFYRLKLELISALNNLIIRLGYYLPYHQYQFFKIINSNLISYSRIPTPTTTLNASVDNYIFTTTIAREFKYQQFILYWDIDLIQNNTGEIGTAYTARINKIELIGVPIPKTIEFHENRKTTDKNEYVLDSYDIYQVIKDKEDKEKDNARKLDIFGDQVKDSQDFDVQPISNSKIFQSSSSLKFIDNTETQDLSPVLFDENSNSAMIENKIMNISRDQQWKNHRCYGLVNGINKELVEYNDNPIFCKSFHPEISQNGIWDAPCQVNTDCPFYQANKNYPNEFGKCDKITGKCEMPLGVIPIGFTKYGKIEPKCYNCGMDSLDNRCCSKQAETIKNGTVGYKSPDYIFADDNLTRRQFSNDLDQIGLKANPSI